MKLTTIFCYSDDFCKFFEKEFNARTLSTGSHLRKRDFLLSLSEVIAIIVYYHESGYKTFKDYYTRSTGLKLAFPNMPTYNRFLELQQLAITPLAFFTKLLSQEQCDGTSFIDSFSLEVSHPKRVSSHKTFRGIAKRGKTSMGWFFGFKVHLIINSTGEILNFEITKGNIADNNSKLIEKIMKPIHGKIYGDKGYLLNSELFESLYNQGIHVVTKIRKNMQNKLMVMQDKLMLRKRGVIESVGAILKESFNIEHSRYRNPMTLLINVCAALIAYSFRENKPSIHKKGRKMLAA
jgi:hypothetical protein